MIYFGNVAEEILQKNLQDRSYKKCQGYFAENNSWIAFDNRSGECYVEEFATEQQAICWLEQFFEISEIEDFKVSRLLKNLFFIHKKGFLKVHFDKNTLIAKFYPLTFLHEG